MKKFILFALACVMFYSSARAQFKCGTDDLYRKLTQGMQVVQQEPKPTRSGFKKTASWDTATYDATVVIHVVHDYGAENLSDDTIMASFKSWAKIFMKQNADTTVVVAPFDKYIGNAKLRMHLATKDPLGNPTKGIVRHHSYLTDANVAGGDADQAKMQQWPQDKYINIWFVEHIGGGVTAYSNFPSMAVANKHYDGIISNYLAVDYDNIMPHELGHFFNLWHIWGGGSCGSSCGGTDSVDDTPPTKGHLPSVPCSTLSVLYDTTCTKGYLVHYTDIYGADSIYDYPDTTNTQNIMDYTICKKMFTKGQCARMRSCIADPLNIRHGLTTPATLTATGALGAMPDLPPVADFTLNKATGAGIIDDVRSCFLTTGNAASFEFMNASWNDTITGVSWSFSNGAVTPSSTSMTTVANKFSVPGWVTVTLTANSNAGSNTLTNTHAVYAADTTPAGIAGYTQNFPNAASVSKWPTFNYYNNPFKWEFFNGAGKDDNSCMRYLSFDATCTAVPPRTVGTARGDIDDLFTPAFDLTGSGEVYLNFYTAGASTLTGIPSSTSITVDTLEVLTSIDGGAHWQKIKSYDGYELQNNGLFASSFTPGSAALWEPRSITIPSTEISRNTFFRFRYRPGNSGNNLYLDNFYLYPYPVGVREALSNGANPLNIFPNPSSNGCSMVFRAGADNHVTYSIADIAGRVIMEQTIDVTPLSIVTHNISRSAVQTPGVYFVTVVVDNAKHIQKLIVKP